MFTLPDLGGVVSVYADKNGYQPTAKIAVKNMQEAISVANKFPNAGWTHYQPHGFTLTSNGDACAF